VKRSCSQVVYLTTLRRQSLRLEVVLVVNCIVGNCLVGSCPIGNCPVVLEPKVTVEHNIASKPSSTMSKYFDSESGNVSLAFSYFFLFFFFRKTRENF